MKKILPLLLAVLACFACSSSRSLGKRNDNAAAVTARLNVQLHTNDLDQSVGGSLRMRRDSVIQISLSKFGIEGVRLVFTTDSLLVLDKINKRFFHRPYAHLNVLLSGGEKFDFALVQRFFWNDRNLTHEEGSTRAFGLIPLQATVERSKLQNLAGFNLAEELNLKIEAFDSPYQLNFRLSKLKENDNWDVLQRIPKDYQEIDQRDLLRLLQKFQ